MLTRISRSGGRSYLQLVESFLENGKVKQHTVASLGRLDEVKVKALISDLERSIDIKPAAPEQSVSLRRGCLGPGVYSRARCFAGLRARRNINYWVYITGSSGQHSGGAIGPRTFYCLTIVASRLAITKAIYRYTLRRASRRFSRNLACKRHTTPDGMTSRIERLCDLKKLPLITCIHKPKSPKSR